MSQNREEAAAYGHVLTPGRYLGAEDIEGQDEPFGEKMARLAKKLDEQFAESARLEAAIRRSLRGIRLED